MNTEYIRIIKICIGNNIYILIRSRIFLNPYTKFLSSRTLQKMNQKTSYLNRPLSSFSAANVHATGLWYRLKRNFSITFFISLELIFNWDQLEADHICIHINVRLARQQQNKLVDLNQIQSFFREISKELLPLHVSFL